jgi:hypothetical protein
VMIPILSRNHPAAFIEVGGAADSPLRSAPARARRSPLFRHGGSHVRFGYRLRLARALATAEIIAVVAIMWSATIYGGWCPGGVPSCPGGLPVCPSRAGFLADRGPVYASGLLAPRRKVRESVLSS